MIIRSDDIETTGQKFSDEFIHGRYNDENIIKQEVHKIEYEIRLDGVQP